eukprot:GEMP01050370.1.p1 GENE.GEMP01050370.1~~GEMP01050370.1.p1  ORF type:complete len:320 (+),score=52.42 GEMP01050370.1:219-1178(+)
MAAHQCWEGDIPNRKSPDDWCGKNIETVKAQASGDFSGYCAGSLTDKLQRYMYVSATCKQQTWAPRVAEALAKCEVTGDGLCYLYDCAGSACSGGGGGKPVVNNVGNCSSCPDWTKVCNLNGYCDSEDEQFLTMDLQCESKLIHAPTRAKSLEECQDDGTKCFHLDGNRNLCPDKGNASTTLLIVICVIILIVLVGGGVMWHLLFSKKKNKPAQTTQAPAPQAAVKYATGSPGPPSPRADSPSPRADPPSPRADPPSPRAAPPSPRADPPSPRARTPSPKANRPIPRASPPSPKPPVTPMPPQSVKGIKGKGKGKGKGK